MMSWIDIASIVFVCVTANHLGLIKAVEETFNMELPIVNCVRCSTFWMTCCYGIATNGTHEIIMTFAISFIACYCAIWMELIEGFIDTLYEKCYEKIFGTDGDDPHTAAPDESDTSGTVSELR